MEYGRRYHRVIPPKKGEGWQTKTNEYIHIYILQKLKKVCLKLYISGPNPLNTTRQFVLTAVVTPEHKPRGRLKKEKDDKKETTRRPLHSSHVILTQTFHSLEADTIVGEQQTVCGSMSRETHITMNMADDIHLRGPHRGKGAQNRYLIDDSESR